MKRGIGALIVALGVVSPAHAAPGDPRLFQGVLEWPAKLTVEPFVVIRADDGRWYYAEIKGAKRLDSGPMNAGSRVSVLGTEGAKPHEITAIALGSGDAAALALALVPRVNTPTAATPVAVEAPSPSKTEATEPSSPPKMLAKPEPPAVLVPAAPAPAAASAPVAGSAPATRSTPVPPPAPVVASAPAAAPAPSVAPAPAATPASAGAPAPVAPAPTPASAPVVASAPTAASPTAPPTKAAEPPLSDSSAPAKPRVIESPSPTVAEKMPLEKGADSQPSTDGPRWTELRGTVKVIAGNWIVVRTDNGQLVLVDLSTVRNGTASIRPGAAIALYGTPTDQKFQAMGIVPPDNRPPARPTMVPPRR